LVRSRFDLNRMSRNLNKLRRRHALELSTIERPSDSIWEELAAPVRFLSDRVFYGQVKAE